MSGRVFVDVSDLDNGALRAVELEGRKLVLCRAEDRFYALENRCPHAFAPLDAGRLRGFVLECPLHGGRLDVRDGSPCGDPIRRPVAHFAVRPVEGGIEIDLAARAGSPRESSCTT
jgi:nitrite reductase/ring-hydroxylating ferredoxin subunit